MSQLIRKGLSSHSRSRCRRLYEMNPGKFVKSQKDYLSYHQVGTFRFPGYELVSQRCHSTRIFGGTSLRSQESDERSHRTFGLNANEFKKTTRAFCSGVFGGAKFDTSSNASSFWRYHPSFGSSLSLLRLTIKSSAKHGAFSLSSPFDTAGFRPALLVPNNNRHSRSQQIYFSSSSSDPSSGNRNEINIKKKRRNSSPNYSTSAKIPTPKSSQSSSNSGILGSIDVAAMSQSMASVTLSAVKSILTFIIKLPYNSWYFLTRPEERRAKIAEIVEITKKEVNHYWMGTKV